MSQCQISYTYNNFEDHYETRGHWFQNADVHFHSFVTI